MCVHALACSGNKQDAAFLGTFCFIICFFPDKGKKVKKKGRKCVRVRVVSAPVNLFG